MKSKSKKRAEAEQRSEKWSSIGPLKQLESLNKRGMKATKQRIRLQNEIAEVKRRSQVG